MKQSDFTIPCVIAFFIYAITIPIEQHFIFGEENCSNSICERISLPYSIQTTTTIQQDGESDENEPITDLPVIDSPCKSSCPPNYKLCSYMCI
ncbi:MAG TPA: hypothetical protein VIY98_04540 [Nitrososphaeraceae archaeon]|jgi:hypothetical protein